MNPDAAYAFYGSLRRGMSNHKVYAHSLAFIKTVRLPGFRLYALSGYPFAVQSGAQEDTIVAELFKVTHREVEQRIHSLELSVGYYYDEVNVEGKNVGIYLFKSPGNHPPVESGDWVHFFGH